MNKFINSNIGLLFALTMLICAAGVEGMTYELKTDDFTDGFFAGYYGKPCPEDASEEYKNAYGRGYETSERESAIAENMK